MRITLVTNAYGRNLTPQNQVSFGWFDKHGTAQAKEEERAILSLLPELPDYAVNQLREHPAVILKRDGNTVYGVLNKNYENADCFVLMDGGKMLSERTRKMMSCLYDLQVADNFVHFWQDFLHCCRKEENPKGDAEKTSSSDDYPPSNCAQMDAWDVAHDVYKN